MRNPVCGLCALFPGSAVTLCPPLVIAHCRAAEPQGSGIDPVAWTAIARLSARAGETAPSLSVFPVPVRALRLIVGARSYAG